VLTCDCAALRLSRISRRYASPLASITFRLIEEHPTRPAPSGEVRAIGSGANHPSDPARSSAQCHVRRGRDHGLIRLRSSTFFDIRINTAMQVTNVTIIRGTIISSPENRKVGGSTPPLATTSALLIDV
jgi:hypothetical protein